MASTRPARDRIERGAIEFRVVDVGDADGTASCFQFGPHLRQLDRQLVGSLGGHIQILEDDGPLVLELFVKHEIESVVGHSEALRFRHCTPDRGWLPDLSSEARPVNITDGSQLQVSLDGIVQEPGVDYMADGDTLTMAVAPPANSHFWLLWFSNAPLTSARCQSHRLLSLVWLAFLLVLFLPA